MAAINLGTTFTTIPAVGSGMAITGRNQDTVILYVDYQHKGTETGIKFQFSTRNPGVSATNFYLLEERNASTEIVDIVVVKVQAEGKCSIPIPIPIRSDFCLIDAQWDGIPDATSIVNLEVDLNTFIYV